MGKASTGQCHLDTDDLFDFYEKHYFHEVEMREKLHARVQVSFAMIAALSTVMIYMIRRASMSTDFVCLLFWFMMMVTLFFFVRACYYFKRSLHGYTYNLVPTAKETEDYRELLISTYSEYDNCQALVSQYFKKYLMDKYIECTTANTIINEKRSNAFHNLITFMICSFVASILTLVIFHFGSISTENATPHRVKIIEPITFVGVNMTKPQSTTQPNPPPPPKAPQSRQVREGVDNKYPRETVGNQKVDTPKKH